MLHDDAPLSLSSIYRTLDLTGVCEADFRFEQFVRARPNSVLDNAGNRYVSMDSVCPAHSSNISLAVFSDIRSADKKYITYRGGTANGKQYKSQQNR